MHGFCIPCCKYLVVSTFPPHSVQHGANTQSTEYGSEVLAVQRTVYAIQVAGASMRHFLVQFLWQPIHAKVIHRLDTGCDTNKPTHDQYLKCWTYTLKNHERAAKNLILKCHSIKTKVAGLSPCNWRQEGQSTGERKKLDLRQTANIHLLRELTITRLAYE